MMKKAYFYEVFGALVDCPYCDEENELDIGASRYFEGEEVTCVFCDKVFELGESL